MKRPFLCVLLVFTAFITISCSEKERVAVPVNSAAPLFSLTDIYNRKVGLSDYKGKVVMLEFFASWCAPCRLTASDIRSVYEKYRSRGFVVLAISIDEGPDAASAVEAFVKEFRLSFPAMLDNGKISRQYGVVGIPTSVIIDRHGTVIKKHIGVQPDMPAMLSREIEALL